MNGTESIEKKLTRAFVKVAAITAAVAFVALLALIIFIKPVFLCIKEFWFCTG